MANTMKHKFSHTLVATQQNMSQIVTQQNILKENDIHEFLELE